MAHAFVEVSPSSLLVFLILDSMRATAREAIAGGRQGAARVEDVVGRQGSAASGSGLGQRPCFRARLVEAPVSSFAGSRSSWKANQSRRCSKTSGRRCSSACAVSFKRDAMAVEEAPEHGNRKALAAILDQALLDLEQRDVRRAADQAEQRVALRLDTAGPAIAP